jgi:hypothetical protein
LAFSGRNIEPVNPRFSLASKLIRDTGNPASNFKPSHLDLNYPPRNPGLTGNLVHRREAVGTVVVRVESHTGEDVHLVAAIERKPADTPL